MTKVHSEKPEEWVGKNVEVLSMDNKLNFKGKISSYDGKVMSIEDAAGGSAPKVIYNQEIKLRVYKSGGAPLIVYGYVCGSGERSWKLDRLESCSVGEKREHFRHGMLAQAKARPESGEETKCQVMDVSAGGLLFKCRSEYEVGETVTVSELQVVPDMAPFTFRCAIRRRQQDKETAGFIYGCQFDGIKAKEEDRIMKAILMAQRERLSRD